MKYPYTVILSGLNKPINKPKINHKPIKIDKSKTKETQYYLNINMSIKGDCIHHLLNRKET